MPLFVCQNASIVQVVENTDDPTRKNLHSISLSIQSKYNYHISPSIGLDILCFVSFCLYLELLVDPWDAFNHVRLICFNIAEEKDYKPFDEHSFPNVFIS